MTHTPLATCFHGGAFFEGIGPDFATLEKHRDIINADVLDAWYPPAPAVVEAIAQHLPWLLRTSPPTDCSGLIAKIAAARGVETSNILPGAGSSDLIFRAFLHWLTPASRVLILDPTYGEYAHVLEKVIHCRVDRLPLSVEQHFCPIAAGLEAALQRNYDLVVIVNPNSPTGTHIPREVLESLLSRLPTSTRCWVDETYIDFAGAGQSLEKFAATSRNVIVCKSMSKAYALSGARVAYLCGHHSQLASLLAITPPWVVGLPSQLAAVRALECPAYYAARHAETHALRTHLHQLLSALGLHCQPGIANFILARIPPHLPAASHLVQHCRQAGVYVRDAQGMGQNLGDHWLRIAVKSAEENARIAEVLGNKVEAALAARRARLKPTPLS